MKKFCLPLFIIMTMLSNNVWGGGCQPSTVGQENRDDFLSIDGVVGSYQCNVPGDNDYDAGTDCDNNQIVISLAGGKIGDSTFYFPIPFGAVPITIDGQTATYAAYFKCIATEDAGDDRWTAHKLQDCTSLATNAGLKTATDGSVEAYITTTTQVGTQYASSSGMSSGYKVVSGGGTPCIAYKCKGNKVPNSDGTACVTDDKRATCVGTGGRWKPDDQECDCTGNADLEQDGTEKCKCRSKEGQEYHWSNNSCVTLSGNLTYVEVQRQNESIRQTANERRASCSNSGGSYSNSRCSCTAPNTRVQNYACLCQSGYDWKNANDKSQGCIMTNETAYETACDAAVQKGQARKNTYPSLSCVCNEGGYELDVNAGECKPGSALAECQPLMAQNKARWDATNKVCNCTQSGYALENGECVETAEGAATRKANELATAKAKIENVHSKLKKTQDGFKVSAWKNEEGNFNTARLASDSIAGVVVGTAGGLLTSKIVKKNQVEDGFEDIQCTIGGQTVAGWGDEFSVGNQM